MFKPSYTVVTSVLVVLAILAIARQLLVGYLPPAASNRLEGSRQGFLASAGHFQINWHVIDEDTFRLARRGDKPILLVIGIYGGRLTRDLDNAMFGDSDTAQYVAQNFFCIRIDGYEHPEWLNALLPISRIRRGIFPGFQCWVLDADGHVLDFVVKSTVPNQIDKQHLYHELVQARRQYEDFVNNGPASRAVHDQQQVDLDLLGSQTGATPPSFGAFTPLLAGKSGSKYGGFPQGEIQSLYPNAWRFLTLTGNSRLFKSSLDPLLFSPLLDVQEGGFFRLSDSLDTRRVEFDKNSRQNSEMMLTLAIQGQVDGDQFYQAIAESTFDWLVNESRQNRFIPASQEDDENRQGRSPRLSFPAWKLREALSPKDQDWAADQLGLNPFLNAQMVPYVLSRNTFLDVNRRYVRVLDALRSSTNLRPRFSDTGYLDVNGHTLARLLEVARIWGDPDRLRRITPILRGLARFKFGGEFIHRADDPAHRRGYLGDYLGYADARLQEYLATGNIGRFRDGLQAVDQAMTLFRGVRPGQFNLTANPKEMNGFDTFCVPDISDDMGESCTAQAIRLLFAYGRLLGDTKAGRAYLDLATKSTQLFANIAYLGGTTAAGYFCSAAEVSDDIYAISVGPRAKDFANVLYHRIPTRFIAPAIGGLRLDLQHRGAGIYLVGKTVKGPFSVEQAAERLPTTLIGRLN